MASMEELQAAYLAADEELVTYAAAMAGRPATEWTMDERAHLYRLGETARKTAEELSRAREDWDEWCRRSLS